MLEKCDERDNSNDGGLGGGVGLSFSRVLGSSFRVDIDVKKLPVDVAPSLSLLISGPVMYLLAMSSRISSGEKT